MKNTKLIYFLPFLLLFFGCADLKQVNDFALSSRNAAAEFESLPVHFYSLCQDICREKDLQKLKLNASPCDCRLQLLADSVNNLFYNRLEGYLNGLESLSADKLTSYNADTLASKFTNSDLGRLKISTEQARAYGKIGDILFKAVADAYRRKKIKQYIHEANPSLQVIIYYLSRNIDTNLVLVLHAKRIEVESDYFGLLKNEKISDYERRKLIEDFQLLAADMDSQERQLKTYTIALRKIAQGHQQLDNNRDKLDLSEIKVLVGQYAADIKDINTQIKVLKK
jgi:hypothetical protein